MTGEDETPAANAPTPQAPPRDRRAETATPEPDLGRDSGVVRRGGSGLRPWQLATIVACLFVVFLFVSGPIWEHPWDPNLAILASYAPIPLVVAVVLLATKRFTVRALFFDSLLVGVAKFVVTAGVLITLWATHAPPTQHRVPMGARAHARSSPNDRAIVRRLADDDRRPARATFTIDATGFTPRTAELAVGDILEIRGTGGGLHTVAIARGTTSLANAPVLSNGRPTRLELVAPLGEVTLRCTVHAESRDEASATLVVRR